MVAYSFNRMFVQPMITKRKIGTIRAERKRHARVGEEVQHYVGMRTRQCELVGRSTCIKVLPIWLDFPARQVHVASDPERTGVLEQIEDLDGFARGDGFDSWQQLERFWEASHPGKPHFYGRWIVWEDSFVPAL